MNDDFVGVFVSQTVRSDGLSKRQKLRRLAEQVAKNNVSNNPALKETKQYQVEPTHFAQPQVQRNYSIDYNADHFGLYRGQHRPPVSKPDVGTHTRLICLAKEHGRAVRRRRTVNNLLIILLASAMVMIASIGAKTVYDWGVSAVTSWSESQNLKEWWSTVSRRVAPQKLPPQSYYHPSTQIPVRQIAPVVKQQTRPIVRTQVAPARVQQRTVVKPVLRRPVQQQPTTRVPVRRVR